LPIFGARYAVCCIVLDEPSTVAHLALDGFDAAAPRRLVPANRSHTRSLLRSWPPVQANPVKIWLFYTKLKGGPRFPMLSEDLGRELLEEMKQKSLRPFNMRQVGRLEAEIEYVDAKLEALKREAAHSEVSESLSVNFAALKAYRDRDVRILRAYKFFRMRKIQDNYFDKHDIKRLLSTDEQCFENAYGDVLDGYLEDYRHLDFRSRDPPLNFYVQIMTLENCGLIMSGSDFIDLKKGRLYFLKMRDIAHLIDKKLVKIV